MGHRPPVSSVHEILQGRILEWVACPPPGNLPNPGIEPMSLASSALAGGLFTTEPPEKPCLNLRYSSIQLGVQYNKHKKSLS